MPSPSNVSKEPELVKRCHRILIVNETIETYLDSSSDDSDSNELSIDESASDLPPISENRLIKSLICNSSVLNLISSEEEDDASQVQLKLDGFEKTILPTLFQSESVVDEASSKVDYFNSRNGKIEENLKSDAEGIESTSHIEIIEDKCVDVDDFEDQKMATKSPQVNSIQRDIDICERKFRKIAPKEMPLDSRIILEEIWRINPPKSNARKKKRKIPIKRRFERKKSMGQKKIMSKIERIHTPEVQNLAMEVDEYIVPEPTINDINLEPQPGIDLIQCPYCSYKHPREGGIKKHLTVYHGGFTNCPHCYFQTLSWKIMQKHYLKHYTYGVSLTCPFCKKTFEKLDPLKAHMYKSHRNTDPSECHLCGMKISTSDKFINVMRTLRQHVLDEHLNKTKVMYKCPLCFFITTLDLEMKSHIYMSHADYKSSIYQCSECPNITTSLTDLVSHLDLHRNGVERKCSACKFVSLNNLRMTLHVNTHSERRFKCIYCNARFKLHFLVKYHMQSRHKRMNIVK